MRAIVESDEPTVSEVSRQVSLSQATVTNILNRLEGHGLIRRQRSAEDKRRVNLRVTSQGQSVLDNAPKPLQEGFVARFNQLEAWEEVR